MARDVHERMSAIADRFEADLDSVVAESDAAIFASMPALAGDAAIAAEVEASTAGNLRRFIAVTRRSAEPPPPEVAPEALDVARTLVRRGIESDAIYDSYRRGQQIAWRRWMTVAEEVVGPGEELFEVLDLSLRLMFDYVDRVLGRVIAEMQREREAVLGGALARRTETVRLILDGAPVDRESASRRLGYDLERRHTAVVVWAEPPGVPQGALESAAVALARVAGGRTPLTLPAGATTLWAWIPSDTDLPPDHLGDTLAGSDRNLRAAVGPTRRGMTGFRRSHEAALGVHRLLAGNPGSGRLATYRELEVTSLAAQDQPRALEFVAATLGPLAANTASAERLRETLRVFLDEAENAPRAAARLHTHRNTILQRVARATELLGHRPGDRRLEVELALELRRRLGAPAPG